jgi:Rrf2 family protein
MRLPARLEYAVRALVALAAAEPARVNARVLADAQDIPAGYLYDVLADLRRVDLVYAQRGSSGGYALTRPAAEITLGTVIRLLDQSVSDLAPEGGLTARLHALWDDANRASLERLDEVTLADIAH